MREAGWRAMRQAAVVLRRHRCLSATGGAAASAPAAAAARKPWRNRSGPPGRRPVAGRRPPGGPAGCRKSGTPGAPRAHPGRRTKVGVRDAADPPPPRRPKAWRRCGGFSRALPVDRGRPPCQIVAASWRRRRPCRRLDHPQIASGGDPGAWGRQRAGGAACPPRSPPVRGVLRFAPPRRRGRRERDGPTTSPRRRPAVMEL